MGHNILTRSSEKDLSFREIGINKSGNDGPKTINSEKRTVSVIAATENPVKMYSWKHDGRIDEILLMSGVDTLGRDQIPLLNTHDRYDIEDVIGKVDNFNVSGKKLTADVMFSGATDKAETAFKMVEEGTLKDFSVGYRVIEAQFVPEGESAEIQGKKYKGPAKIATKWELLELSLVPIGADPGAVARSEPANKKREKKEDQIKKENNMDPKLRAFLEARGMDKGLTDEEALDWAARNMKHEPAQVSEEEKRQLEKKAVQDERIRMMEAKDIARECGFGDDFEQKAIDDGIPVDEIRARALDLIRENSKTGDGLGHRGPATIQDGGDEKDKFRAAAQDALIIRSGGSVENPAPGATDLTGYSMTELARKSLKLSGRDHRGRPHDMMGRALSSTDFPKIISNLLHNELHSGFETEPETWKACFGTGSVSDFKTHYQSRKSETQDLGMVKPGQPYPYGKMSEHQESYKVDKYGEIMTVDREMLINDNLGAITNFAREHGEASSRLVGDVAWAAVTDNANMGDGKALFVAAHNNLATAAGSVGVATLNAANLAMGTQKDLGGKRTLNIIPKYYAAPKAVEGTSEIFFSSTTFTDADTIATDSTPASTQSNIWGGTRLIRIYEPRLDSVSATAWYLFGMKGKTVVVFFLDDKQTPFLDSREGWTVDGVEFKVRIEVGAKAMAWEPMYLNEGA